MRTHKQIISSAGAQSVIDRAGLGVTIHTVRSWQQRDGIPAQYWAALDASGIATLVELAAAADLRRTTTAASASADHAC
jgi:hypothetical protein